MVVPSPSFPSRLSPQPHSEPSSVVIKVWEGREYNSETLLEGSAAALLKNKMIKRNIKNRDVKCLAKTLAELLCSTPESPLSASAVNGDVGSELSGGYIVFYCVLF